MNIYLAGPMTGLPHFNSDAFNDAADFLREQGHEVFNPVENDAARYGPELFEHNYSGNPAMAAKHGFSLRASLFDDLQWICTKADAIALLPGWESSSGAKAEWEVARALKLHFIYL